MNFSKNTKIFIAIAVLLSVLLVCGAIFMTRSDANNSVDSITAVLVKYEKKFPFLREVRVTGDIKGTTSVINDGWNYYENKALGFSLGYPNRKFAYGVLKPTESKGLTYNHSGKKLDFYAVSFSYGDSPIIHVNIEPSRFHTIEEWIKNNIENRDKENVVTRRNIAGFKAVVLSRVFNSSQFTDEEIAKTAVVIKDDILYTIRIVGIPREEYEHVWESFKFLGAQ